MARVSPRVAQRWTGFSVLLLCVCKADAAACLGKDNVANYIFSRKRRAFCLLNVCYLS